MSRGGVYGRCAFDLYGTATMRRLRLNSDSAGATAIEYAIIAGLIGLGLVASLVTTRGSLSAIFGVASSQMGSSSGGAASANAVISQRAIVDPSTSARAPYWNAKTLTSKVVTNPTSNSQLTTFTYADGAKGSYLAQFDSTGKLTGEVVTTYPWGASGRTNDAMQFTYDANGNQTALFYTNKNASGGLIQTVSAVAPNWLDQIDILDGNGNVTYHYTNYSDPAQPQFLATGAADEIYFRGLSQ